MAALSAKRMVAQKGQHLADWTVDLMERKSADRTADCLVEMKVGHWELQLAVMKVDLREPHLADSMVDQRGRSLVARWEHCLVGYLAAQMAMHWVVHWAAKKAV